MRLRLGSVIALSLFSAVACGGPEDKDDATELVLWHAYRGAEAEALNASIQSFRAENPALSVRAVSIPYDAFANKLRVSVPRGNGPDVFIFAHDQIGDWARANLIEPLDTWATVSLLERFFARTLDAFVFDDALYGLPLAFKTLALFYDTKLVSAPAKTTNALIRQCQTIRRNDPTHWGLGYEVDSLYFHAPWLHGFGGRIFDGKGALKLDSQAMEASINFVRRLLTVEKIMPEEATSALVTSLFKQNKLAYVISGPWFLGELRGQSSWGVTALPTVSETGLAAQPYLGVEGVLMSARSRQKAKAFRLMRFLTRDRQALVRWKVAQQLVANAAVFQREEVSSNPVARAFKAQLATTLPLSNQPIMKRVWTPMKRALTQGIVRGVSPKKALDDANIAVRRFDK
ncbi:MAG: extracellular solute-binding protein [Myxococcota bacterium]|nr:extracellular solute-binding protein [Myxococcota bacterium]